MKPIELPFQLPHIPERFHRPLKWVGFPLVAVAAFNLSLYATLPRDRIQDRLETMASEALGAKVTLEGFGLTMLFGPGVTADALLVAPKMDKAPVDKVPGEKVAAEKVPKPYRVQSVTVRVGALAALRGKTAVSFNGLVATAKVDGQIYQGTDRGEFVLNMNGVPLSALPNQADLLPIPIDGKLTLEADLTTPKNLFAEAEGSIAFTFEDFVLGDGKTKYTNAANPMLAQGLTVPRIKLGKLVGTITVVKGKGTIKELKAHGQDVDLELDGTVDLRDPLPLSQLKLYLRVKPTDALLKREAALEVMVNMGGSAARRSDGYYGISIAGAAQAPLVLPSKEPPQGLTLASVKTPTPAPPAVVTTTPRPVAPPIGGGRPSPAEIDFHPPPAAPPPPQPGLGVPSPPPSMPPPPPPPSAATPSAAAAPSAAPRLGAHMVRSMEPASDDQTGEAKAGEAKPAEEGKAAEPAGEKKEE